MRKINIIAFLLFGLLSCESIEDRYNKKETASHGREVELLFEKDDVKVYRFKDHGNYQYFTVPPNFVVKSKGKRYYIEKEKELEKQ